MSLKLDAPFILPGGEKSAVIYKLKNPDGSADDERAKPNPTFFEEFQTSL